MQSEGAEDNDDDSDFNPQLKINGNAPQILIKCIKNLDALQMEELAKQKESQKSL